MKELLQKCQELFDDLTAKVAAVGKTAVDQKKIAEDQATMAKSIANAKSDLVSRESKVKGVEDTQAILAEAKTIRQENIEKEYKHKKEIESFDKYRADELKELSDKKADLDARIAANKKTAEELEAGKVKLAEDRKNMKKSIIAEMSK